jgi:choline dehydrogenase
MIPPSSCPWRQPDRLGSARGRCASQASYTTPWDTTPELAEPDLQLSFAPGSFEPGTYALEKQGGMTVAMYQSYPESAGWVRATSADAAEAPAIQPNYLSCAADEAAVLAGIGWVRRIIGGPAFAPSDAVELRPGANVRSSDELLAYARAEGVSGFHFVGTCRMGVDAGAVVSPDLKVRGVSGLRVCDASVLPSATSGNANAPTLMAAEKCADMILRGEHERNDIRGPATADRRICGSGVS